MTFCCSHDGYRSSNVDQFVDDLLVKPHGNRQGLGYGQLTFIDDDRICRVFHELFTSSWLLHG